MFDAFSYHKNESFHAMNLHKTTHSLLRWISDLTCFFVETLPFSCLVLNTVLLAILSVDFVFLEVFVAVSYMSSYSLEVYFAGNDLVNFENKSRKNRENRKNRKQFCEPRISEESIREELINSRTRCNVPFGNLLLTESNDKN